MREARTGSCSLAEPEAADGRYCEPRMEKSRSSTSDPKAPTPKRHPGHSGIQWEYRVHHGTGLRPGLFRHLVFSKPETRGRPASSLETRASIGNYGWKLRVILETGLSGNTMLPLSEVVYLQRS
jgi:hypothetical protein